MRFASCIILLVLTQIRISEYQCTSLDDEILFEPQQTNQPMEIFQEGISDLRLKPPCVSVNLTAIEDGGALVVSEGEGRNEILFGPN